MANTGQFRFLRGLHHLLGFSQAIIDDVPAWLTGHLSTKGPDVAAQPVPAGVPCCCAGAGVGCRVGSAICAAR